MIMLLDAKKAFWHAEATELNFIELPEEEQKAKRKGTKARGGFMSGHKGLSPDEAPTPRSRQ